MRSRPPRFLTVPAPRGGPPLRGQHAPRLGQDHPREAPPAGDASAVDVLEVVALLCGEIDRALPGEVVEPGVALRRQVVVGEVVEGEAPYRATHRGELLVDRFLAPEPVQLVQAAGELADAGQVSVVRCVVGHLSLRGMESGLTTVQHLKK
jgi:hypothetical protein